MGGAAPTGEDDEEVGESELRTMTLENRDFARELNMRRGGKRNEDQQRHDETAV